MIRYELVEGRIMINALDLYELLGKPRGKYQAWVYCHITENSAVESPRDFIVLKKGSRGAGNITQVILSLTLSKSLCFKSGTTIAKKIRYYIEDNLDRKSK